MRLQILGGGGFTVIYFLNRHSGTYARGQWFVDHLRRQRHNGHTPLGERASSMIAAARSSVLNR